MGRYKITMRKKAVRGFRMFAKGLALCIGGIAAVKIAFAEAGGAPDRYPEKLAGLLERNEETFDYVASYPDRGEYQGRQIDLTQDFHTGEVPLLMQWDRRWGYDAYGDDMIGLSGCGPVCLTMAYLYFTGDTSMTPREMAEFAYENGYYTEAGTSWNLWTEGAAELGMYGDMLSMDEAETKRALDAGWLIVCSMGPGDFTTTGHFILIRGYDENGFYVNDPKIGGVRRKNWPMRFLSSTK